MSRLITLYLGIKEASANTVLKFKACGQDDGERTLLTAAGLQFGRFKENLMCKVGNPEIRFKRGHLKIINGARLNSDGIMVPARELSDQQILSICSQLRVSSLQVETANFNQVAATA